MADVVVEARNGSRIPWSYWHDRPLTRERVPRCAWLLSDPVCMYDCDIPVDGVAAFVFTTAERARDLPNPPVYVAGLGMGTPVRHRLPQHWPLDDIMDVGRETVRAASGRVRASPSPTSTFRSSTTASHRSSGSGWRRSASAPSVRRTASWPTAGSVSNMAACPCCQAVARSAMVGCTACRKCSKRYLQLSKRGANVSWRRPTSDSLPAIRRRTSAAPSSTPPSRSEVAIAGASSRRCRSPRPRRLRRG